MLLISFLFFAIKSDFSSLYPNLLNNTVDCIDRIALSFSVFYDMSMPVISNCMKISISFNDCLFSNVVYIIDTGDYNWKSFSFTRNCCINDEIESNHGYISLSSELCQFKWNTFSYFSGSSTSKFIYFNSPDITITNINLTNNKGFDTAISIVNPSTNLQFNDITFNGVVFRNHIHILNGESKTHYFDRIYDNGGGNIYFMKAETSANFIISRVFMQNRMEISINHGFIWFVDSYMYEREYGQYIGPTTPRPGSIVYDSIHAPYSNPFFIDHLSVPDCPTNDIQLGPPPHHTVGTSMKVKIAFSFIGGALFGVALFLIIYFTVKYSIKCYQKKQDQKHPVFDI